MSFVIAIFECRLIRNCALLAIGCLFKTGVALGMPMPSHGETTRSHGTISFSGAVVTETCALAVAGEVPDTRGSAQARGECHSGENRTGYRLSASEIGEQPTVRLLRYAKDTYGKATVLTYVYD